MSKITVKSFTHRQPWRGQKVLVELEGYRFPKEICIFPVNGADHETIEYFGVNWSAFGSVPPAVANDYAAALQVAVATAQYLTKKYKGHRRY